MRAESRVFAYTNRSMTARGNATKSWWCMALLLAGCVAHHDQPPSGTFGHSRSDLFAAPVTTDLAPTDNSRASNSQGTSVAMTTVTPEHNNTAAATAKRGSGSPTAVVAPTTAATAQPLEATAQIRRRSEHDLRNAFANADRENTTQSALDLAGYLVQQERHFEALFVIDTALQRHRSMPLRLARIGLLRDVARCDLAASELQAVVRQLGAENVSPATLFDLVQVQWVAGDGEAAAATLRSIQQAHAGDPWLGRHATAISEWDRKIHNVTAGRDPLANGELRDLFALLRAAPNAAGRLKILNTLAAPKANSANTNDEMDSRRPVRARAIAIACADESTAVRARAVFLAAANQLTDENFWQAALKDAAPLVRRFAATGAAQQHGPKAAPHLLEAIAREHDEQAFRALHAALAKALSVDAPTCTAETEAGRKQAVTHWRIQCDQ